MSEPLCTIAFHAEAHDTAADSLRQIAGLTVTVVPKDADPFDAELLGVWIHETSGCYVAVFAKWDAAAGRGDRSQTVTLDIYTELDRIEVI